MNRIDAIYSYIDINDKVVDVGCDQAKLSLKLASRCQHSIACDISEKVINKARKSIDNKYIDLRVSDGLYNIKKDEADTLVLSGMGTHTILEILNNTNLRFKKIITISNNYHDILRNNMNDLNYKVECEQIIKENNKYYNLILFTEGKKEYNDYEVNYGLNHKDEKMYIEYLNYLKDKYIKIKNESNNKNEKINYLLELLDKKEK